MWAVETREECFIRTSAIIFVQVNELRAFRSKISLQKTASKTSVGVQAHSMHPLVSQGQSRPNTIVIHHAGRVYGPELSAAQVRSEQPGEINFPFPLSSSISLCDCKNL